MRFTRKCILSLELLKENNVFNFKTVYDIEA